MTSCKAPVYLKDQGFSVGCGHCPACLQHRKSCWSLRLSHQAEYFRSSSVFLTLTYAPKHLPHNEGMSTLKKKDYQSFVKRLRRRFPEFNSYYVAGEYGEDRTLRPHYHFALFGISLKDLDIYDQSVRGDFIQVSRVIDELWDKGFNSCSALTPERMDYVAGYIQKKFFGKEGRRKYGAVYRVDEKGKKVVDHYRRVPPFSHMSHGIGLSWALEHSDQLKSDLFVQDGKFHRSIPRYYRTKLGITQDDFLPYIKEQTRKDLEDYDAIRSHLVFPVSDTPKTAFKALFSRSVINEPAAYTPDEFKERFLRPIFALEDIETYDRAVAEVYNSPFYNSLFDFFYSPSFLNHAHNRALRACYDIEFRMRKKHPRTADRSLSSFSFVKYKERLVGF